ncbi:hypothetical protein DPMN_025045 [Dreissena polymorpha]|uniref:Uncharacterized protein n=1 Tax=Dreissena polymorpha TaxID=45954 RepID=A0A9D4LQJ0_DREPO|nr:hypothetical protein DPMN_025045 [Dreissena polymorpha]
MNQLGFSKLELLPGSVSKTVRRTDERTDGPTDRPTGRPSGRQTDRQTDRPTDRQTANRQTDSLFRLKIDIGAAEGVVKFFKFLHQMAHSGAFLCLIPDRMHVSCRHILNDKSCDRQTDDGEGSNRSQNRQKAGRQTDGRTDGRTDRQTEDHTSAKLVENKPSSSTLLTSKYVLQLRKFERNPPSSSTVVAALNPRN